MFIRLLGKAPTLLASLVQANHTSVAMPPFLHLWYPPPEGATPSVTFKGLDDPHITLPVLFLDIFRELKVQALLNQLKSVHTVLHTRRAPRSLLPGRHLITLYDLERVAISRWPSRAACESGSTVPRMASFISSTTALSVHCRIPASLLTAFPDRSEGWKCQTSFGSPPNA